MNGEESKCKESERDREREIVLRVSIPALETSRLIPFSKSSVPLIGNYFLTHDKTRSEFLCFFESLWSPINQEERGRSFLGVSVQTAHETLVEARDIPR
jgi:hypothetical protein